MNSRILFGLIASMVAGIAITLISSLLQTPMAHLGVDVVYWGVPLPWTMEVIPTRFYSIDWVNFIANLVFWLFTASLASTSFIYLVTRRRTTDPGAALSAK